jgi:hypothetical protein
VYTPAAANRYVIRAVLPICTPRRFPVDVKYLQLYEQGWKRHGDEDASNTNVLPPTCDAVNVGVAAASADPQTMRAMRPARTTFFTCTPLFGLWRAYEPLSRPDLHGFVPFAGVTSRFSGVFAGLRAAADPRDHEEDAEPERGDSGASLRLLPHAFAYAGSEAHAQLSREEGLQGNERDRPSQA